MDCTCGIVAEFNPFHNGHYALIKAARAAGAQTVVAVMSGNFVQRGSPAITDKRVRAAAALRGGVDLVIELPLAAAVSTAQRFARGAVHLLAETGCVDMLAFGSECGDIAVLRELASAVDDPDVLSEMRRLLSGGLTFAKARELAVANLRGGELAAHLSGPNNALGIEYLRQAQALGWKVPAMTMGRVGAKHDDSGADGVYASASWLRKRAEDIETVAQYVPGGAAEVYARAMAEGLYPADPGKLETAILAHLRRLERSELLALPDLSEGIENRLYAAIREAPTIAALEFKLKTKRYTMARVRRLILAAFLGLTKADCDTLPPYLRVLGFSPEGRKLLAVMKKKAGLPLDTSLARLRGLGGACERFAALEGTVNDLYGLCLPKPPGCGYEYTKSGIYMR